ncbi:hypothetical protein [Aureibacter tunicatorum]|uniref:hypothetical protein n=1 Tax=Aureibacter tunicatorum TaxID=866807 RepID=UPI00286D49CD|nr:hypothetical protein [Aureibacter tunicatorum]
MNQQNTILFIICLFLTLSSCKENSKPVLSNKRSASALEKHWLNIDVEKKEYMSQSEQYFAERKSFFERLVLAEKNLEEGTVVDFVEIDSLSKNLVNAEKDLRDEFDVYFEEEESFVDEFGLYVNEKCDEAEQLNASGAGGLISRYRVETAKFVILLKKFYRQKFLIFQMRHLDLSSKTVDTTGIRRLVVNMSRDINSLDKYLTHESLILSERMNELEEQRSNIGKRVLDSKKTMSDDKLEWQKAQAVVRQDSLRKVEIQRRIDSLQDSIMAKTERQTALKYMKRSWEEEVASYNNEVKSLGIRQESMESTLSTLGKERTVGQERINLLEKKSSSLSAEIEQLSAKILLETDSTSKRRLESSKEILIEDLEREKMLRKIADDNLSGLLEKMESVNGAILELADEKLNNELSISKLKQRMQSSDIETKEIGLKINRYKGERVRLLKSLEELVNKSDLNARKEATARLKYFNSKNIFSTHKSELAVADSAMMTAETYSRQLDLKKDELVQMKRKKDLLSERLKYGRDFEANFGLNLEAKLNESFKAMNIVLHQKDSLNALRIDAEREFYRHFKGNSQLVSDSLFMFQVHDL